MKKFVLRFIVWACLIAIAAADEPAGPAAAETTASQAAAPAPAPSAQVPAKKKKRKRKKKKPAPDASGVPSDPAPGAPPAK